MTVQAPAQRAGDSEEPRRLTRRASDVAMRSVRWAWRGWLPIGYPSVLTGIEGLGKSTKAAWMIARFTRGKLEGEWHGQPVTVLVVADEDGIEDMWQPRVKFAGADRRRVEYLDFDELGAEWDVHDGIGDLVRAIDQTGARVVFIDALMEHMPLGRGGENVNSPTFVRHALRPLKHLARKQQVTILYSLHPPKSKGADFRDVVQNSQAFSAIARTGLLFDYHPDDHELPEQQRRRVLVRGKGNMGRDPGAIEFRITGRAYTDDDGLAGETEVVCDVGPSTVTRAELLTAARAFGTMRTPSKAERAAELIAGELSDGEWHDAQQIRDKLFEQGLNSNSVVTPATQRLKVEKSQRAGVLHGGWIWRLSQDPDPETLTPRARDGYSAETLTPQQAENPVSTVRVSESQDRDQLWTPDRQSPNGGTQRARDPDGSEAG